jgi:hypothetical protein
MQGLTKLLGKDMPEIAYLKQAGISEILSKGLAETFRARPLDPKTYFAKYLLNHAQDRDTDQLMEDRNELAFKLRSQHADKIAAEERNGQK